MRTNNFLKRLKTRATKSRLFLDLHMMGRCKTKAVAAFFRHSIDTYSVTSVSVWVLRHSFEKRVTYMFFFATQKKKTSTFLWARLLGLHHQTDWTRPQMKLPQSAWRITRVVRVNVKLNLLIVIIEPNATLKKTADAIAWGVLCLVNATTAGIP